jgi:FAD dependent monooxygenase
MTPNIGQGANTAIEDSATLANLLRDALLQKSSQSLSDTELGNLLRKFQSHRFDRVSSIYRDSRFLVRFQARDGFAKKIFGRYYAPYAGDLPADMASKTIADGPMIKYISLPKRSGPGWLKYSTKSRGVRPTVLIAFFLVAISCMVRWQGRAIIEYLMSHFQVSMQVE